MAGSAPIREPIVDKNGRITPVWQRYFVLTLNTNLDQLLERIKTLFTDGSVPYVDNYRLAQDNDNLFWDKTDKQLRPKSIGTEYIDFDVSAAPSLQEARMWWDDDAGTAEIGLKGGNVNVSIGQELLAPRAKAIGSDIADGQVVYVSGASGVNPHMSLAKADAVATCCSTIAVATEDVSQNSLGYFVAMGLARDLDTSAWVAGDELFLSATTAGALTTTEPTSPNFSVSVGVVTRSHATEGVIFVGIRILMTKFSRIYGMTSGAIPFADANGFITQDAINLFWDNINKRLGVGTSSPGETVEVSGNVYLTNDGDKILLGLGKDVSLYFDGTNFHIKTNNVAPSDLLIDCGTEKTVELVEPVWEDINFGPGAASRPAASAPTPVTFLDNTGTDTGITTDGFAVGEKLSWAGVEYEHGCKDGADMYFHVHVQCDAAPTGTDKAQFQIKYTINHDGETCDPVTTIVKEIDIDTQYHQYRFDFPVISVATIAVGDQISVVLERIAASANEYAGDLKLKTFGIHVQKVRVGSRTLGFG